MGLPYLQAEEPCTEDHINQNNFATINHKNKIRTKKTLNIWCCASLMIDNCVINSNESTHPFEKLKSRIEYLHIWKKWVDKKINLFNGLLCFSTVVRLDFFFMTVSFVYEWHNVGFFHVFFFFMNLLWFIMLCNFYYIYFSFNKFFIRL